IRRLPSRVLPLGGNGSMRAGWRVRTADSDEQRQVAGQSFAGSALKTVYLLITIMVLAGSHPQVRAQEVTSEAPPVVQVPDAPDAERYSDAVVLPGTDDTVPVVIESDTQAKTGSKYTLDGDVVITYRGHTVEADHIEYDSD